ncbi:MAG: hypothetical protein NTY19_07180 [Planctomycetota bacterium]|nr:hypothetical protein [Planctomycetota bacterium]
MNARPLRHRSIVACCPRPRWDDVHYAARAYQAAGYSLIPIAADGSKRPVAKLLPDWKWTEFQTRLPTLEEIDYWFHGCRGDYGIGIIGGHASGGLEVIDVDDLEWLGAFRQNVEMLAPGLWPKLIKVRSPRPGMHLYYRCDIYSRSGSLARALILNKETGKLEPKPFIEIKGQGGVGLSPPSPCGCHHTGRPYVFEDDADLTMIARITPKERDALLVAARSLNQWEREKKHPRKREVRVPAYGADRPGDDFNNRATWAEILEPHGWAFVHEDGFDVCHWRRPGKNVGTSATTNYSGEDRLYVFSTSAAPFDEDHSYSKFEAYTWLEHDGDFSAAARDLASRGFGGKRNRSQHPAPHPHDRYSQASLRSTNVTVDRYRR